MERTLPSEGRDAGSIPAERTKDYLVERSLATFAFRRAAVFLVISPRFAALSIALYAKAIAATSPFLAERAPLRARLTAFLRASLKTFLRSPARWAFLADFVIAIRTEYSICI